MDDHNPLIDGHTDPANVKSLVPKVLDNNFTETARRLDGWTPERERIVCERPARTKSADRSPLRFP